VGQVEKQPQTLPRPQHLLGVTRMIAQPITQRLTIDEFIELEDRPENADKILELIDGEVVEKMGSFKPSRIASRIAYFVENFLMAHPIGFVTGADGSYRVGSDMLIPDVGYIARERMPEIPEREVLTAPDLAVEVLSPTDSKRQTRRKAERYLDHGTRLVWLVFPETREVEVYAADADVVTVGIDGALDGGDVLPGFTLPVRSIFPE
jgi:Uma2 family endonuclease